MSTPTRREVPAHGAPPPEPEWTFLREGQVYGPVPESQLRALVRTGELDAATFVSHDGATYRPMAELSGFVLDLKKAEAEQRVQQEITDSRRLAARRRLLGGAAGGALALLLVGLAGGGAVWLATARPWQRRSALLEDFGAGIAISVPARIGAARARPAAPDEVVVPVVPGAPPRPALAARPRGGLASPAARAAEGDLVQARWDPGDIQAVVSREQRTLAPCIRQEAARSPEWAGEIPIEFAIGNEGRVESLWIDEPRFKHGPLADCLLQALRGWRFKPFPGQRPTVSLAFRVGGP